MSFIKCHKYAFISLLFYLLPALLLLGPHGGWFPLIVFRIILLSTFNQLRAVLAFMLASYIIGIVFAVQSIRHKEPIWVESSHVDYWNTCFSAQFFFSCSSVANRIIRI